MLELFLDKGQPRQNALRHPLAETLRRQLDYTEKAFESYYERSGLRLPNNHILVQFLRSLSFKLNTPFEEVWASVKARAPYVGKHYGFTSPISFGRPHHKVFYSGDNSSNDYIFTTQLVEVDPFDDSGVWRQASPFRVLYHSVTDFHLLIPNGSRTCYSNNFSVTIVDTELLALQYHTWKIEQYARYNENAIISPEAFLVKNALPKILRSHFNLCIVNNVFSENGFDDNKGLNIPWPPLSFPDFAPRVKPMTTSLYRSLKNRGDDYARSLESIALPHGRNALRDMVMPRVPMTKQGSWIYWLARFRYMLDLMRLGGDRGIRSNRKWISALKRELLYFKNDKGYNSFGDEALKNEFLYFVGYVENI